MDLKKKKQKREREREVLEFYGEAGPKVVNLGPYL
jgi:hypothetical protein